MPFQYDTDNLNFSESIKTRFKDINYVLVTIIAVLVIATISFLLTVWGLVITYQKDSSAAYNEYRNEVRLQNEKIDALTNEIRIQNEVDKAIETNELRDDKQQATP